MKKRVCIFSYYDSEGKIGLDTIWLLNNLKKISHCLIFVSNGKADCEAIETVADYIMIRDNTGLDGGAYKCILKKYDKVIFEYDELIFCNSTFFGPFIPFESIIEDMNSKKCDFYGIVPWRTDGEDYIQSYFLIFKGNVFKSDDFRMYFEKYINEKTKSYSEICFYFERELQYFLKKRGFKSDTYIYKNMASPYEYPYELLSNGVPIMKKKCFDYNYHYCDRNELLNCLTYIYKSGKYNINYILDWVNNKWNWNINVSEVSAHSISNIKHSPLIVSSDRNDLERFYEDNKDIYIYGAGKRARRLLETLIFNDMVSKLRGILVSDIYGNNERLGDYPVHKYDKETIIKGAGIIVALNTSNSEEVSKTIMYNNVLYLTKFK